MSVKPICYDECFNRQSGKQFVLDLVYLDIAKVFDSVPHGKLYELEEYYQTELKSSFQTKDSELELIRNYQAGNLLSVAFNKAVYLTQYYL